MINATNVILKSKIEKIRSVGFEPIVEIFKDNLTDNEAYILEKQLILKFGKIYNNSGISCDFTKEEILQEFIDRNIIIPEVFLKEFDNEIWRFKLKKYDAYLSNKK